MAELKRKVIVGVNWSISMYLVPSVAWSPRKAIFQTPAGLPAGVETVNAANTALNGAVSVLVAVSPSKLSNPSDPDAVMKVDSFVYRTAAASARPAPRHINT